MDRMRLIVALALVLVVLVGLSLRVATRRTRRPPVAEPQEAEVEPIAPRRYVPPERSSLGPSPSRERSGVARLSGRVLPPQNAPGGEGDDALSGLKVVADDGARTFDARLSAGGRFAFHLPPGRYTLTASAADLVGAAPDVLVRAGVERDIDIRLGPGAKISGTLRAPAGSAVSVKAAVAGEAGEAGEAGAGDADGDGAFEVVGLVPGRRYDLTFTGPKLRAATLRGVVAPAEGQEVAIDPLAVVRGAIGFPRGEKCPIDEVKLEVGLAHKSSEDDDDPLTARPGADCRFELAVPENVPEATVVASGTGWFLEERVEIPARGDPDPLCLNPPCRDDPTEGLAALRVSLEGVGNAPVTAQVSFPDDGSGRAGGMSSCSSGGGSCLLQDLPVGQPLEVTGYGHGCRAESRTVTLPSGETSLRLACRSQRRVEGVIRVADGTAPEAVTVRCAGGGTRTVQHTRLFALTCAAEDAVLEYQTAHDGPWQSVALPVAEDPAFVEIGL
jgi:hypothetical protein